MNEDRNETTELLLQLAILGIFLLVITYFLQSQLVNFSVWCVNYAYQLVHAFPFLQKGITDSQYESIITLFNRSTFRPAPEETYDRISALITLFQIPLALIFMRLLTRYRLKTLPATFSQKIETPYRTPTGALLNYVRYGLSYTFRKLIKLISTITFTKKFISIKDADIGDMSSIDAMVSIKKDKYPYVSLPYEYAKVKANDDFNQRWGKLSMEEGVIRWCIKRELVRHTDSVVKFSEFSDKKSPGFTVNDSMSDAENGLVQLKDKLDINIDKMAVELRKQLGKPFDGVESLPNEYIALAILFLMYSKGNDGKEAALAYKNEVARMPSISNMGKANENWSFNFNRKRGIKRLKSELKKNCDRMMLASKTDYMFMLSCYHYARSRNGDITPPDFQWLILYNRELYLLLHCYNGDPQKANNSPYIEVVAPWNQWHLLYAATEEDRKNAASTIDGYVRIQSPWITVYHKVLKSLSVSKETGSVESHLKGAVGKALKKCLTKQDDSDEGESFQSQFLNQKRLNGAKLDKSEAQHLSKMAPQLPRNDVSHQVLIDFAVTTDQLAEGKTPSQQLIQEVIDTVSWVRHFDGGIIIKMIALYELAKVSGLTLTAALTNVKTGVKAGTSVTFDAVKHVNSKYVKLNFDGAFSYQAEQARKSSKDIDTLFSNPAYTPLAPGISALFTYKQETEDQTYSSEQLLHLVESDDYVIEQSIKSIIFYMTDQESWLKSDYQITQEQLIGSPVLKKEYI